MHLFFFPLRGLVHLRRLTDIRFLKSVNKLISVTMFEFFKNPSVFIIELESDLFRQRTVKETIFNGFSIPDI
jgi:hypothetical protein